MLLRTLLWTSGVNENEQLLPCAWNSHIDSLTFVAVVVAAAAAGVVLVVVMISVEVLVAVFLAVVVFLHSNANFFHSCQCVLLSW